MSDVTLTEAEREALRAAMLQPHVHRIAVVERILGDRLAAVQAEAEAIAHGMIEAAHEREVDAVVRAEAAEADRDDLRARLHRERDEWQAEVSALTERQARDLIERLCDEQANRCAYGTRDGDGRTCDCKYAMPLRPPTSETTGCPELRGAIRVLRAALAPQEARDE